MHVVLSFTVRRLLNSALIAALVFTQCTCAQVRKLGASSQTPTTPLPIPPAPTNSPALEVTLKITRRPSSAGVPLAESANVRDVNRIALVDATGKVIAAQFRVLSRWRGTANDSGRPIKWLLVDADVQPGNYQLTIGNNPAPAVSVKSDPAASVSSNSSSATNSSKLQNDLQLDAGRIKLRAAAKGSDLISSYQIDGAEQLSHPMTLTMEQPRVALLVSDTGAGGTILRVTDTSLLEPGSSVKFENAGVLPYGTLAGSNKLVGRSTQEMLLTQRTYRLEEGTSRQEDVFVEREQDGSLYTRTPFRFSHPEHSAIRDLGAEEDTAVIRAARDQTVILERPLRRKHSGGERVVVVSPNPAPVVLRAYIDETSIEERGPVRLVLRQSGYFLRDGANNSPANTLRFTLRYHVYANQPFVRTQLRILNTGAFGFGGARNDRVPFAQHAIVRSLAVNLPFTTSANARLQRLEARSSSDQSLATVNVSGVARNGIEVSVPEFAENYPKRLSADSSGAYFEILPRGLGESLGDYVFDGARAKTTEFYFGLETRTAAAMANSIGVMLDPAYIANTQAIRPVFVEKRNWMKVFSEDRTLGVAATRLERWLAGSYSREANESNERFPGQSVFEVRRLSREGKPEGETGQYGWRNFGDLTWADGYCNLHYDLPYVLMREYARTGDARAFQLGSEMTRYRADWGQYHADDYWDGGRTLNLRGLAFYEKGEHGTYREPVPSHDWVEGLWLYWAMTGDENVHQSAIEAAEALANHPMWSYEFGVNSNEPRWYGWPVLGLMASWRYTGETRYLEQSRKIVYLMIQSEERYGRKGYYLVSGGERLVKPFMWSGYTQLGPIEYWRETKDQKVADFLVRVADWLIGKNGGNPALLGGTQKLNGEYIPLGTPYVWSPDKEVQDQPLVAYAMMSIPVLTVAARISGRADLRDAARKLFRDTTYYRDVPENTPVNGSSLSTINFRSLQYNGSAPKVYGQFSLFTPDYLMDYVVNQGGMKKTD